MKSLRCLCLSTVVVLFVASSAMAQHHHHHGGHHPIHHGSHFGHNNWHHVVPHHHHQNFLGTYYTEGTTHYYTPTPIVRYVQPPVIVGSPPVQQQPPPVVQPQNIVQMSFGGYARYDDLSSRMVYEANAMCLEMHYNYQHNKNFTEVYREAYGVLEGARFLQGKQHNGDRVLLNRRMVELDKLFHHIQDEMRGWTRVVTKQIDTTELPDKVAGVEAVIHHLAFDLGVKPHEQGMETAPPPGGTGPETAPRPK